MFEEHGQLTTKKVEKMVLSLSLSNPTEERIQMLLSLLAFHGSFYKSFTYSIQNVEKSKIM